MRLFYFGIIGLFICTSLSMPPFTSAEHAISVSAEHAVVLDQETGEILYAKEAETETEIASLTKIMTAIIAIELGDLTSLVPVSEQALYATGSSIYLQQEEILTLEDLLYGLMLRSGNDAAVTIAEHIGGSVEGFTYLMNEKVHHLGLKNSHFTNPHGLDEPEHYSSAYDIAKIMQYCMKNESFRLIAGTESYHSKERTYQWNNKNRLLTELYEPCIAGKTGFTKKAGRTLVSSAEKDGKELIVVTLNASDDWNDHQRLYEWAFQQSESATTKTDRFYEKPTFIEKTKQIFIQLIGADSNG